MTTWRTSLFGMLALACPLPQVHAQASLFSTPGMPSSGSPSPRFNNEFNPAIGLVFDLFGAHTSSDTPQQTGIDMDLRSAELSLSAWVDPSAYAYANIVFDGDETALEEGAVHYTGLGGNSTLRIGRFFVDFGKQMQAHEHALRTPERPAVLRTFLGSELGGDGLEYDSWFTVGEDTIVRYSVGAFGSLIAHSHEHPTGSGGEAIGTNRPGLNELSMTARLTGFTSLTDTQTLQLGASLRSIPEFGFEDDDSGVEVDGHDNRVIGLDATWGWTDATETQSWTLGAELLFASGALSSEVNEPTPGNFQIDVLDDDATGFYGYLDHAWDGFNSAGIQYSRVETLVPGLPELSEFDAYFTHRLSEFQRMRFALTASEIGGNNDLRIGIQYTAFLGPHAHGVNF